MRRRSTTKIDVTVEQVNGKPWAKVRDKRDGRVVLVPSFEDLLRIIMALVWCERNNYPELPWDAAKKVRQFLHRSMDATVALFARDPSWPPTSANYEAVWARLASEFDLAIPEAPKPKPVTWATTWKPTAQDQENERFWNLDKPDPPDLTP